MRKVLAAAAVLLVVGGCSERDPFPTGAGLDRPIQYEIVSPPPGTPLRRGDWAEFRVRVTQGPETMGVDLGVGVEYIQPDGRPSNTYLAGAETDSGGAPFPVTLSVRFIVPEGIPDNGFIPPGSQVTALTANLRAYLDVRSIGPGKIATYPIVD